MWVKKNPRSCRSNLVKYVIPALPGVDRDKAGFFQEEVIRLSPNQPELLVVQKFDVLACIRVVERGKPKATHISYQSVLLLPEIVGSCALVGQAVMVMVMTGHGRS